MGPETIPPQLTRSTSAPQNLSFIPQGIFAYDTKFGKLFVSSNNSKNNQRRNPQNPNSFLESYNFSSDPFVSSKESSSQMSSKSDKSLDQLDFLNLKLVEDNNFKKQNSRKQTNQNNKKSTNIFLDFESFSSNHQNVKQSKRNQKITKKKKQTPKYDFQFGYSQNRKGKKKKKKKKDKKDRKKPINLINKKRKKKKGPKQNNLTMNNNNFENLYQKTLNQNNTNSNTNSNSNQNLNYYKKKIEKKKSIIHLRKLRKQQPRRSWSLVYPYQNEQFDFNNSNRLNKSKMKQNSEELMNNKYINNHSRNSINSNNNNNNNNRNNNNRNNNNNNNNSNNNKNYQNHYLDLTNKQFTLGNILPNNGLSYSSLKLNKNKENKGKGRQINLNQNNNVKKQMYFGNENKTENNNKNPLENEFYSYSNFPSFFGTGFNNSFIPKTQQLSRTTNHPKKLGHRRAKSHDAISNRTRFKNYLSPYFQQIIGVIYNIAKDPTECCILQKKIEKSKDPKVCRIILNEISQHIIKLIKDPFGNYLIQKIYEFATDQDKSLILEQISSDFLSISLNQYGTRAVQKIIELIEEPEHSALIIDPIKSIIIELSNDPHGNHILQKCLLHLHEKDKKYIYKGIVEYCVEISTHKNGCCVIQRCIDSVKEQEDFDYIVQTIVDNALVLIQDRYGNYVVQYILDLGFQSKQLALVVKEHFFSLSIQKFSSNVVEKCLKLFNQEYKKLLIYQLINHPIIENNNKKNKKNNNNKNEINNANNKFILKLLKDRYANYVIQTALDVANDEDNEKLSDVIYPHLSFIVNTRYGKKIQQKIYRKNVKKRLQLNRPRNRGHVKSRSWVRSVSRKKY
ncbi:pumilio homology domain family member 4 [Anaeramoeba flamelloides]|uniref:Pumilio homology domain family member 4 n=1 Tax=Anaeramoeba flamelloides TaxID=1746091 RepID=A0ABQ8Y061_9EUKA|nr:pumilio homology domain family member 4 [Anaeramoeba flamelloides]